MTTNRKTAAFLQALSPTHSPSFARHGDCRLAIGQIAALAGICPRSVRNGLRAAEALGALTIEERRFTAFRNDTNVVRIASPEWRGWLRLKGGGCKSLQRTPTNSFSPAPSRSMAQRAPEHIGYFRRTREGLG